MKPNISNGNYPPSGAGFATPPLTFVRCQVLHLSPVDRCFPQTPSQFAGNATSRYALGWSYSGLRLCPPKAPVLGAVYGMRFTLVPKLQLGNPVDEAPAS